MLFNRRLGLPAERCPSPGGIPAKEIDFCGAEELLAHGDAQLARVRLDADFFDAFASPCEADAGRGERRFRELPDRQALAGSEDERARLGMLEHPMHAVDIFLGVAPVPDRVEVRPRFQGAQKKDAPRFALPRHRRKVVLVHSIIDHVHCRHSHSLT